MRQTTRDDYRQRMLRVLVHIQQNLSEALELEDVARVAHFSPYHFHRVFSGMVGESLKAHVRRLRLERAAGQLAQTDDPVIRIALRAGYETHEAFSRAFKSMIGQSPTDWRRARREAGWGRSRSGVHYLASAGQLEFEPLTDGGNRMEVKIEKLEPQHVAFVRHVGPYENVGSAWETLCGRLGPAGLLGPQARLIGLSHDDPEVTPPEKLRYDACIPVGEGFTAEGDVGVQEIEGGLYAVTVHKGPYTDLKHTYAALCGQWMPSHGKRFRDAPCFEVYLNDPQRTPPPELLTEICVPLAE